MEVIEGEAGDETAAVGEFLSSGGGVGSGRDEDGTGEERVACGEERVGAGGEGAAAFEEDLVAGLEGSAGVAGAG